MRCAAERKSRKHCQRETAICILYVYLRTRAGCTPAPHLLHFHSGGQLSRALPWMLDPAHGVMGIISGQADLEFKGKAR